MATIPWRHPAYPGQNGWHTKSQEFSLFHSYQAELSRLSQNTGKPVEQSIQNASQLSQKVQLL